ncbi:transmembrane emp24 domain-containing protein 1a isoform X2 [Toxotes jaculatrix]|uniref:transmembrane emp24 domain-containing protein 1a isoform X2 n=1 Tax=Toxotes jaculatrix TaxID=941984 RepID=UPI001B3AB3DA|nr:transmembrane emp24 domain-containing protein 1a isoform X2 [Toxotes jaculatrix]
MHCDRMMMNVSAWLCLLTYFMLTVDLTLGLGPNQDMEFTFLLPAGSTECFYQTTVRNDSMEVEYQVIAGSGLDVGFALISPSGHRLVSDFRRSDGIHTVDPTEDGDYRLCFDNSFSKLSEKMVFFETRLDSVYQHLERSRQVQTVLRAFEARDRYLLEDNLWRVSFWSCLNLLVMFAVAVTQIYTLQRLFDNTRRVCT